MGSARPCSPAVTSRIPPVATNLEGSEPQLFGFVRRFHYIGMSDRMIDHSVIISTPSPSFLPRGQGLGLKVPTPSPTVGFSWQPPLSLGCLGAFQKSPR